LAFQGVTMSARWLVWLGDDWGYQMSSAQQLARALAGQYRTLWVNSVGMRRPRLTRRDLVRMVMKLRRARSVAHDRDMDVTVANVPLIPFHRHPLVAAVNARVARARVAGWRRRLGVEHLDVVCALPSAMPLVRALEPRRLVYYCMDDFATLPGVDWPMVEALEHELLAAADAVIAASEWIANLPRFQARGAKVLPHGVDYDHFSRAQAQPDAEIVRLVAHLPRPVIGFAGYLDQRIDLSLLTAIADAGRWGLLLLGEAASDLRDLRHRQNVILAGFKPYGELPRYLAACDVLVAPYVRSESTAALQPLKIPEYLATGKPIVATWIPALEAMADVVMLVDDTPAFLSAIERAAAAPAVGRSERIARARAWSWESRARELAALLGGTTLQTGEESRA